MITIWIRVLDTITADPVKPEEDQEEGTSTQTTKDKEPDETIAEKTEEQTAPKRVIDEPHTSQPQGSMPTSMDAAMKETIEEHSKEVCRSIGQLSLSLFVCILADGGEQLFLDGR